MSRRFLCYFLDTVLLLSTGTSVLAAEAQEQVPIEEIVRIGASDGPEEFLFGRIVAVSLARDGSVYVADGQLKNIRKYSHGGEFLGYVGKRGKGPGEYMEIQGMAILPNAELAVLDVPHRIIFFDDKGVYRGDYRVPSTLRALRMLEIDHQGNIYVKTTVSEIKPGMRNWEFGLLKMSSEGEVLSTIRLPLENEAGDGFVLWTPAGPLRNFIVSTRVAWSPKGQLVVGRNDKYSITITSPEGSVVRILERAVEPAAIKDKERSQWQAWADYMQDVSTSGSPRSYARIPKQKPFFRDIYVGDDGQVWVDRYVEAESREFEERQPGDMRPLLTWREPRTFDVFGLDGELLGTVVLPQDTRLHAMRGEEFWCVNTTDEGEQLVGFRAKWN